MASNPRLTKELDIALTNGFQVTVLAFTLGNWSDQASDVIKKRLDTNFKGKFKLIELDATSKNRFLWLSWGLSEKCTRKLYPFFKKNIFINALANTRRAVQLLKQANSLAVRPDLILAHNMGALYPAYCLGKNHKIPFVFDVEDYHPGELVSLGKSNERKRRKFLLRNLLPKAKAITSASPLIGKYTMELIGGHAKHLVILNSFPESEFIQPIATQSNSVQVLKLIWFGQKIGPGRGLEQLFLALTDISALDLWPIQLTLIGEWDSSFRSNVFLPFQKDIKDTSISVVELPPLPQAELHSKLGNYDIGLALELKGTDLNRQLCLTNKIIAYAQAGLYILATNTDAQSQFIMDSPDRGVLCGLSSFDIGQSLKKLICNKETIIEGKEDRYKNSHKLGWKGEATKITELWNEAIKK